MQIKWRTYWCPSSCRERNKQDSLAWCSHGQQTRWLGEDRNVQDLDLQSRGKRSRDKMNGSTQEENVSASRKLKRKKKKICTWMFNVRKCTSLKKCNNWGHFSARDLLVCKPHDWQPSSAELKAGDFFINHAHWVRQPAKHARCGRIPRVKISANQQSERKKKKIKCKHFAEKW